MAATRVCSSPYPFHCPSWTRSLRVTHELRGRQPQWLCSEFVPFLLLFDCQEAFHCCLVVTCINRINMISIQCHRVGEWWSGKPEFENVSDPAGVYIPFNDVTSVGVYCDFSRPITAWHPSPTPPTDSFPFLGGAQTRLHTRRSFISRQTPIPPRGDSAPDCV